jgi:dinuclear metal center YbgI/SA1388 family protein
MINMVKRDTLQQFIAQTLSINSFKDYCPNGLQVEGKSEIKNIIVGVTLNQALIEKAVEQQADAIIVHHGLFWKGESYPVTGIKKHRLSTLLKHDINLYGYHLPLDCHPQLGNNAQLALKLGFQNVDAYEVDGISNLLWMAELEKPLAIDALQAQMADVFQQPSQYLGRVQQANVQKIAWCSGAAQKYITHAKELGADLYFSGEVSEQTLHLAIELDIHYLVCGHHATERYGVQALGTVIAKQFDGVNVSFIDIPNPI